MLTNEYSENKNFFIFQRVFIFSLIIYIHIINFFSTLYIFLVKNINFFEK